MNSDSGPSVSSSNQRVEYHSVPQHEQVQAIQELHGSQSLLGDHSQTQSGSQLVRRKPLPPRSTYTLIETEVDENTSIESAGAHRTRPIRTGYDPFFARKWVLVCFCALWVAIIVSLQILYSVSETHQGLMTTKSSLRYLWVYGPTAFFVVVTALWRQVDCAAKSLQPWALMSKGPTQADHSLFMDYVTPFQVKALWRACRQRHYTVSATILVFIFIKLSTIVSTGLFSLQLLDFKGVPHQIQTVSAFDDSRQFEAFGVTSEPALTVYGSQAYNLTLPFGTTSQYAFQQAELVGDVAEDTYAYDAELEVFVPTWTCEVGKSTYTTGYDSSVFNNSSPIRRRQLLDSAIGGYANPVFWNFTIEFSDCTINNLRLNGSFVEDIPGDATYDQTSQSRYRTFRLNGTCSQANSSTSVSQRSILAVIYDRVSVLNDTFDSASLFSNMTSTETTLLSFAMIGCIPDYNIQPARVSILTNHTLNGAIEVAPTKRQLDIVNGSDLLEAVSYSLSQSSFVFNYREGNWPTLLGANSADGLIAGMILFDAAFTVEKLLDTDWLIANSEDIFCRHAVQIAYQYLMKSVDTLSVGSIERTESRLLVQELPTRLMQGLGACILVLTIWAVFTMPQQVIPRSVESIAGIATILRRSGSVRSLFMRAGHLSLEDLRLVVAEGQFYTSQTWAQSRQSFSIETLAKIHDQDATSSRTTQDAEAKWVRPLILRRRTLTFVLLLGASLVITMEVLNYVSTIHNGLATVDEKKLQRYTWLYIPVVLMVLVATIFNTLDCELNLIYPLRVLSRGYTSAQTSILWAPLRQTAIQNLTQALHRFRWALAASSIAVVIAPLLTIAASGLLSPQLVNHHTSLVVPTTSWFSNASLSSNPEEPFPIPHIELLLQRNMSLPDWTSDEVAFPAFNSSLDDEHQTTSGIQPVNVDIPAARARVDCTLLPGGPVVSGPAPEGVAGLSLTVQFPQGCSDRDIVYSSTNLTIVPPHVVPGLFCSVQSFSVNLTCLTPYLVVCGSIDETKVLNFTAMSCTAGLETVQTNTTFDAFTGRVIAVTIDETSPVEIMKNYQPFSSLESFLFGLPQNISNESLDDGFSEAMVYGKDGIPMEELLDPVILTRQFTHTYRQLIAQTLNTFGRTPLDDLPQNLSWVSTPPTKLSATFSSQSQRLFVNGISLRVLEGLLGTLMLCALIICVTADTSMHLPKQMGSIAATVSLLAGSRFVDPTSDIIPPGTEWFNDRTIRKRKLWEGQNFRMGWWTQDSRSEGEKAEAGDEPDSEQVPETEEKWFGIDCRPAVGDSP